MPPIEIECCEGEQLPQISRKTYVSSTCNNSFSQEGNGNQSSMHKCTYCIKKFTSISNKRRHEESIHMNRKAFECEICSVRLATKVSLEGHNRSKHGHAKIECQRCNSEFSYLHNLAEHSLRCNKKEGYQCDTCKNKFTTKRALDLHLGYAHGDPKNTCEVCGKSYKYPGSLRRHKISH